MTDKKRHESWLNVRCFLKQLFLRVQARAKLEQPMKRLYRIITRSRAAPAWYGHTAVQCACAVDTVTVDKADHSQAWPWPELGGSAPVPLGQRLCLNSVERGESTRALLSGGLWEDSSRINKKSDCQLDENRTTPSLNRKRSLKILVVVALLRATYKFYLQLDQ